MNDKLELTYESAKRLAAERHAVANAWLPKFPDENLKAEALKIMKTEFKGIIIDILNYEEEHKDQTIPGHRFRDHLRKVAYAAPTILQKEFERFGLEDSTRYFTRATILAGLFHDIERHQSFTDPKADHAELGAETAERIMKKHGLDYGLVIPIVLNHDNADFNTERYAPEFKAVFNAVFDTDKFMWGKERGSTYWLDRECREIPIEDAITDYRFLEDVLDNPDFFKSKIGKQWGPRYIAYGLEIAKYVEQTLIGSNGKK